jgi:DNA-binding LacI/PurR family transcriptional regulator
MSTSVARFQGYVDALREYGCEVDPELVIGPDNPESPAFATQEEGYDGMRRLAALRNPPTAVFGRNDAVAMGALRAAHDLGLKIPEDVAIAGFDNLPISAYTSPPLTTVNQPTAVLGHRAAEFVLDRIEGRVAADRRDLRLYCEVVVRESTVGRTAQAFSLGST